MLKIPDVRGHSILYIAIKQSGTEGYDICKVLCNEAQCFRRLSDGFQLSINIESKNIWVSGNDLGVMCILNLSRTEQLVGLYK